VKKLSLELGASCPVIILPDADLELASTAVAAGGFINAGQVCISVQRVIVDRRVEADFLDALVPKVEAITVGNPKEEDTRLGSLISEEEASRVHASINEARHSGARVLTGGDRDGAVVTPAVVAGVDPRSKLSRNELFGPAVAVSSAQDMESAIALANDNEYGLGAGIFTSDVAEHGPGHAADRRRQHPHQLVPAVAGGPHALRRPERQRHRQGRRPLRRPGNDRRKDDRPARTPLVTHHFGNKAMTTPSQTIRLTTAQAVIKYLSVQYSLADGVRRRLVPAALGIFGHGNVAGLGQALDELADDMPFIQGRHEQYLAHISTAYAKASRRQAVLAVTASIGPAP
jgi:hypothetical protein